MPKVNIYLPDDLAAAVRARGLPVSAICQMALRGTLDREIPDSAVRITEHIDTDLPFSPHLASVISLAPAAAAGKGSRTVDSEHLLQALLDEEENLILRGLDHLGLTRTSIQKTLDLVVPDGTPLDDNDVTFGPEARAILEAAVTDAQLVGNSIVNGANLVWALANGTTGYAAEVLDQLGFFQVTTHQALGLIEVGVAHANRYAPAGQAGILTELAKITDRLERLEASLSPSCS
nr:Clp protease N-terminal domain-containing protein [Rhodococcus qingshengii]